MIDEDNTAFFAEQNKLLLMHVNITKTVSNELLASRALTLALLKTHPDPLEVKKYFELLMEEAENILASDSDSSQENIAGFLKSWGKINSLIDEVISKK